MRERPSYPPDEDLRGPAAYREWLARSSPIHALCELENLMAEEDLDSRQFREEASSILSQARGGELTHADETHQEVPQVRGGLNVFGFMWNLCWR